MDVVWFLIGFLNGAMFGSLGLYLYVTKPSGKTSPTSSVVPSFRAFGKKGSSKRKPKVHSDLKAWKAEQEKKSRSVQ